MARFNRALPSFDRCERPSTASLRFCGVQPGRLAQGPEEKCGVFGRRPGFVVIVSTLPDRRPSVGRGFPLLGIRDDAVAVNSLVREGAYWWSMIFSENRCP